MMRLALVVLCLLAGCSRSGPTVDATTLESFTHSPRVVMDGLCQAQQMEIARVVLVRVMVVATEGEARTPRGARCTA